MTSIKDSETNFGSFLFKYRGLLPVPLLILTFYLVSWKSTNHSFSIDPFGSLQLCFILSLLGAFIRIVTVGYSPKGTSGRNTHAQVADVLVTDGIYSVLRNPLYLGNMIIWIGIASTAQSITYILAILLIIIWFYQKIIITEEQFLMQKFGQQYLSWKEKTPSIMPKFSSYTESKRKWNWRKVIRKEKNGIAAIMAIYGTLAWISTFGEAQSDPLIFIEKHPVYGWMGISSAIFYLSVKLLMKWTTLLENK